MKNKLWYQPIILIFFLILTRNLRAQNKDYEYSENNTTKIKVITDINSNKIIYKNEKNGTSSIYSIEKENEKNNSTIFEYDQFGDKKKIGVVETQQINKIENIEYTRDYYSNEIKTGLDKTTEGNYWRYIYKDGKKVYTMFYRKKNYGNNYEVYECAPNGNRILKGEIKEVN